MPVIQPYKPITIKGHTASFARRWHVEDGKRITLYRFECSCGRIGKWHDHLAMTRQRALTHLSWAVPPPESEE